MGNVTEITSFEQFFSAIDGVDKAIFDFYADWCQPCKLIKPIYVNHSKDYINVKFYSIKGDVYKDIAE